MVTNRTQRISDVIRALQDILKASGDLECFTEGCDCIGKCTRIRVVGQEDERDYFGHDEPLALLFGRDNY
jgi:hypothetical protein